MDLRQFLSATMITLGLFGMPIACAQSEGNDEAAAARLLNEAYRKLKAKPKPDAEEAAYRDILKAGELAPDSAEIQQAAAELLYRGGRVKESIPLFNLSVKLDPERAPENWQRGLALCTLGMWKEGEQQFKTHHDVNPDDVENSAWYFLCVAKLQGIEAARKTVIPSRGDGRVPMMSVLAMLKQEIAPEDVMEAAVKNTRAGAEREQAKFYADLYIGLYYDSLNDRANAEKFLQRSLTHKTSGYMVDTARVYLEGRFKK